MKNLQLSLKRNWFEMTKSGVKTEDYREITQYWLKRLTGVYLTSKGALQSNETLYEIMGTNKDLIMNCCSFKEFDSNTMTLGYPKSTDLERILKLKHEGIEIREGNPEWGAEIGKLYFVIKHGKIM